MKIRAALKINNILIIKELFLMLVYLFHRSIKKTNTSKLGESYIIFFGKTQRNQKPLPVIEIAEINMHKCSRSNATSYFRKLIKVSRNTFKLITFVFSVAF